MESDPQLPFPFRSTIGLGFKLSDLRGTLSKLYGATERPGGGGKRIWRFARRRDEAQPPEMRLVKG